MDENLKNEIVKIIKKQTNCSTLDFDIQINQFPNINSNIKKIYIECSNAKFDAFIKINNEIKEIIKEIEKLNSTHDIHFIFKKCYMNFWNEDINLDWHIELNECNIKVQVLDTKIDELYLLKKNFYNCKFENLSLLSGEIQTVQIDLYNASIDLFQISIFEILDSEANKIELKNCEINKIIIQDAIFKRDFTIYNTKINTITIKNVDFEALSEFNEVTFQEEFDFREITYKGFTLFDKCIFNTKAEFEYIIFEKFTSFRGSTFNKGLNLDYTSGDKEINFFGINGLESKESRENTSRETYRIIKYNFENIGNKIEANEYLTLELEKHRSDIWNRPDFSLQLLRDGTVTFFHWISSNHSSNWFLALVWIFIVSFVTNVWLDHAFSMNCLFKYINVLSSIDDFNESYIVMVMNKVSLGYLYYQFLTAVRKDTRK